MRHSLFTPRSWAVVLCSAAAVFFSAATFADPPARVARLAQISGTVSFSPAGEQDWEIAPMNRPVVTGDRLWADERSHAELQIGAAAARLGENTAVTVLNLDDRMAQFQLAQGELNVRVRRIDGDQFYEVDTPNLAFSIRRVGDYRIDVDPDGNTTVIRVRSGEGEAWGEGTAYVIDAGQQYTFMGEGLRDYRYDPIGAPDEFDRWTFERNRREDAAVSARYVSPEMVGYSDLDDYGTWRNVEGYGTVWVPTQVSADWVPYHYGHWGWVDPWGWTWIDDAPWGFAPFHYGRWAYVSSRWCWVPGPVAVRPVYAPALVAFVGGGGFSLSISTGPVAGVAWFPLGVGEVYRPAYEVSRNYFTQVNVTNTVVNTTYVTNVYNNPNVQVNYRNREVTNAITAVPANAFASGEQVSRHAVRVQRDVVERQQVANVAPVAPTHRAVFAAGAVAAGTAAGAAAVRAAHRPPERALTREVVARTQPPAPPPSFAARQSLLSQQPGHPLDTEKMRTIRTERPAEAPRVKTVSPSVTPRALDKGQAKAGPGGPGPAGQAQEERARERGPQAGGAPQPPTAQERFKGGPQGQAAQEERAMKERRGAPGGPQAGPPTGQAQQEDRAQRERRGGAQPGGVPQPPASAQERFKGGPAPGAQAQDERAMRERRGGGQPGGGPQGGPPPQAQERGAAPGSQAQQERAQQERRQQEQSQRAQQERAQQERSQQERSQQERMQGQQRGQQERAQQERAQQQSQQRAQQERAQQERAQQERAQQERSQQERMQGQQRGQQERAQQERAQQQSQQRAQQERAQQEQAQQQQSQQRAQQERAQQERAQQQQSQQRAPQERAQQERAQQERAQQQSQQRGQQERAQQERAQQQQAQGQQQRAQQERAQQQAQAQQQRAQQERAQQQAEAQQQQRAQQERGQQRGPQGKSPQEKEKEKEPRGQ